MLLTQECVSVLESGSVAISPCDTVSPVVTQQKAKIHPLSLDFPASDTLSQIYFHCL